MRIKLIPSQIPQFWEVIKYASRKTRGTQSENQSSYFTSLLEDLLTEHAQCFVRLGEERKLEAILITKVSIDQTSMKKSLFIDCLYSFRPVSETVWKTDLEFVKQFAIKQKCISITTQSMIPRVFELVLGLGFKEGLRIFELNLNKED